MLKDKWFRIGLVGTVIAALCCFTPLAVGLLGVIGLGAFTIWLDAILIPALIVFAGILVASIIRIRQNKA